MGQGDYLAIGWGRKLSREGRAALFDEDGEFVGLKWPDNKELNQFGGALCVIAIATNGMAKHDIAPPAMPLADFPEWLEEKHGADIAAAKEKWEVMRGKQPLLGEGYLMIGSDYD